MTTYKQIIYDGGDKVLVDMAKKAQKLNTARNINVTDADGTHSGTAASFDGSGDVSIKLPATIKADLVGNADTATNAGHQTTADSATSATSAGTATSASEAGKLSTARSIKTDLASASAASFDGSADITPGVTGVLPIQNGGTGQSSVDTVPTSGSQKMVTSDGVFSMTNTHQNSTLINQLTPSGDVKITSITVPKNGFYLALGCLRFRDVLSVGNMISLGFSVNSGAIEYISTSTMGPNTYGRVTGHYCISLNAGDTIYLTCGQVFQSQIYVDAFLDVVYLAGA